MGCSSSRIAEPDQPPARPVQIGRPEAPVLHVPRRVVGPDGVEAPIVDYDLTRRDIERALAFVAEDLNSRRRPLTIVTVGGAVNTLYLRSREATHDVDFFGSHLNNEELRALDAAMQYAQRRSSVPLGGAWLNNETQLHMAPDVRRFVTETALERNTVVFERPGLRVVAAPWSYLFISKANRIGTEYERGYDLDDAVAYLRHWLSQIADNAISTRSIRDLCTRYRREMLSQEVLKRINREYRRRYGDDGIRQ
ncbi:hypothetical protein HII31_10379 [Pseudocercospora fuligena]|uniref:DUF7582 domain-containing protein n=1 Tax=Pseudocercospora fuligena TaxID=685502 RepID=A0A8H6VIR7_9PEZI|nr:hypothetical protein HII31_10379 [Pseudocercospora fuligena]